MLKHAPGVARIHLLCSGTIVLALLATLGCLPPTPNCPEGKVRFQELFPGSSPQIQRIFSPFATTPATYYFVRYAEYDRFSIDCARVYGRLLVAEQAVAAARDGTTLDIGTGNATETYREFYKTLLRSIDKIPGELERLGSDSMRLSTTDVFARDPIRSLCVARLMSRAKENLAGAVSRSDDVVSEMRLLMRTQLTDEARK